MDATKIDEITKALSGSPDRRRLLRLLAGTAFGLGGLGILAGEAAIAGDAKKCPPGFRRCGKRGKKCCPKTPRDVCPVSAPAPNAPRCGSSALGEECTCNRTTEGNNACINFIDQSCADFRKCSSTAECRETVGFHFVCQAAGQGSCGQRCLPECDNTDPYP